MSGYQLRPKAVADLQTIGDFIAASDPQRAVSFIDQLLDLCTAIAERPYAYQRRDDLMQGVRQAVHGNYLVFFRIGDDGVVVIRILHGARRLEDLI